jgi:hypothetical protein
VRDHNGQAACVMRRVTRSCPLLGEERTGQLIARMSAFDPKRTYDGPKPTHEAATGKKKEIRPHKTA